MTVKSDYSYLDPTYPAYYSYFNRPKTILCLSLRRFILLLVSYDMLFSSVAVSCGLFYLILDRLSHIFQSNEFLQRLTHLPIGIFFDNRIVFKSTWTINTMSNDVFTIIYLHMILNGVLLLTSISMLTAIKYHKPYRALTYFVIKVAYFINTTAIFIGWMIDSEEYFLNIQIFYGLGNLGFFTPNINIFCLGLFECLWKIFTMITIFRSIQYLRDYCLHKELKLIEEYPSSHQLIIHIIPNNTIVNKQYNI